VLLNKGGGAFRHTHDYPLGVCGGPLAVADLNGDGRPDLVGNMWKTGIVVLLNRGDGSFGARRRYPALRGCDAGDVWPSGDCGEIAVHDVNGDGRPDLAVASTGANGVEVQFNRGNGTFAAKLGYGSLGGPIAFGVSDLNHDGRQDLVTANYSSKSVGVLLNKPGLCNVQDVRKKMLQSARQELARANCRVLKVRRAYSTRIKPGRVISQEPTFGAALPKGGDVDLVVSRG
jgi:FG-GAP-like repeat/PASTA domain